MRAIAQHEGILEYLTQTAITCGTFVHYLERFIARILYIDENISARFKTTVEKHHHQVDTISTGEGGLKLYSIEPYDVVVVNCQLTDMAGIDLCRKLRLDNPELSIIFLVDVAQQKLVPKALSLGVSQYVMKTENSAYLELLPGIVEHLQQQAVTTQEIRNTRDELELKIAEQTRELNISEERYRQIAEFSSDWVWEMDAELRFSYLSEGCFRLVGIDPNYTLGKTRREISPAEDIAKPHWQKHLADLDARREFRDFQYELVVAGGKNRVMQISGVPIFDNNSVFQGYRGTATEVTNRVIEQQALAESNSRLQHVVKLTKIGHYLWDGIERCTLSCTVELANIFGVTQAEYVALTDSYQALLNWVHPDDRESYERAINQALDDRRGNEFEYRILARDGKVRYVHEIADAIYDDEGKLIHTAGSMQDITERKEAEEALKNAERLAGFGNWRWSIEKNELLSCSEGYARVLGISRDDMPPGSDEEFDEMVHVEDHERLKLVYHQAMKEGRHYQTEYRIVRPDGEVRDIQEIGEAIYDLDGNRMELKGTLQDITERKNVERAINEAKIEADLANQAKSKFLSSMSHELRTPLNAILGFAQILERNRKDPLTESQKQAVDYINKGGRHLLELITQVLDLARIESGQAPLSIESIDLEKTIQECVVTTATLSEPRDIQLINKAAGTSPPHVLADLTACKQVLLNLLSNAVKYNRDGGKITIETAVTADQMVRISVSDTGVGIDESHRSYVFEAFNRLGRETLEVEGTGIGLTISKQLVELMKGRIDFTSTDGGGSVFWVELPIVAPGQSNLVTEHRVDSESKPDLPPTNSNKLCRVLYIEDNPINRELMSGVFKSMPNIELTTAETAEIGLEMVNSQMPDLILMDIQLPGIDGIEALKILKGSEKTRRIPVVAISASAMSIDIDRASGIGFYDYLTKPINLSKTLAVIRSALAEHHE